MSLILDALNRSERERRQAGDVPGIATEHYVTATVQGRNRLQTLLLGALLVAALAIGWLVVDRWTGPPPAPVAVAPVVDPLPAEPAAAQPAADSTVAVPEEPAPQAEAVAAPAAARDNTPPSLTPAVPGDVASLYQRASGQQSGEEMPASAESRAQAAPVPAAAATGAQPIAAAPAVAEEAVDLEALVALAEEEVDNARLAEHPAPFMASLSQQKKDQIPTLMYSRHDYSSDSRQSAVVINGKSLRAGGSVGGGVSVKEILPDSVVLSHQGTEFRLRALNSWVNL